MHTRLAALVPPPTPTEMASLVARAGLTLNAGQMADLVLSWRHLAEQIAHIPRDRALRDDLPFGFLPIAASPVTPPKAKAGPTARSRA